jgi:hypothetical protein
MRRTQALVWLVAATAVLATEPALANGRFPRAARLLEDPRDTQQLLLGATYGLLTSSDGGQSWHHICELSFGIYPVSADPLLELSSAGVLGGLLQGITLSEDAGCDFTPVLGGGQNQLIADISVDRSQRARVLGLSRTLTGGSVVSELFESADGGQSFEVVGEPLLAGFDFPFTVDSAPSEPERVYVSGVGGDDIGRVLRSNDGGASWETPHELTGTSSLNAPYIAAIDPNRADLLYVRTDGRELVDGQVFAKDSLFIGDLTGEEGCQLTPGFCNVLTVRGKLLGFALSPEGDHVLLGLGDPQDPGFSVDPRLVGLYSGSAADLLAAPPGGSFPPAGFKRVHSAPVSCITWTTKGIYVCTSQAQKGFALGFAPDLQSLENDDLNPLLDVTQIVGPLECPAETSTSFCDPEWQTTCEDLGACGNQPGGGGGGGAAGDGESGAGNGGSSGTTGTIANGGEPSGAGATTGAGTAGRPDPGRAGDDDDSGCAVQTRARTGAFRFALLTAAFVLLIRRRLARCHRARFAGDARDHVCQLDTKARMSAGLLCRLIWAEIQVLWLEARQRRLGRFEK